jgi:hypothetical protein
MSHERGSEFRAARNYFMTLWEKLEAESGKKDDWQLHFLPEPVTLAYEVSRRGEIFMARQLQSVGRHIELWHALAGDGEKK